MTDSRMPFKPGLNNVHHDPGVVDGALSLGSGDSLEVVVDLAAALEQRAEQPSGTVLDAVLLYEARPERGDDATVLGPRLAKVEAGGGKPRAMLAWVSGVTRAIGLRP